MNNSLYELTVREEHMLLIPMNREHYQVTGTMSCLLEEAEDFGKFSNPGWYYAIWKDGTDECIFRSNSYTELLQYLRKEVA